MNPLDRMIDEDARAMAPGDVEVTRTENLVVWLALLIPGAFCVWALWRAVWA